MVTLGKNDLDVKYPCSSVNPLNIGMDLASGFPIPKKHKGAQFKQLFEYYIFDTRPT